MTRVFHYFSQEGLLGFVFIFNIDVYGCSIAAFIPWHGMRGSQYKRGLLPVIVQVN